MNKAVGYALGLCVAVFAILLIVTLLLAYNSYRKLSSYVESTGIIEDFYTNTSEIRLNSGEMKAISPIVSYTVNNKNYSFTGNYCTTSMKKGDTVKILYDASNPEKAVIKAGLYVAPAITGGLSLLFLIGVVTLAIVKSKISI